MRFIPITALHLRMSVEDYVREYLPGYIIHSHLPDDSIPITDQTIETWLTIGELVVFSYVEPEHPGSPPGVNYCLYKTDRIFKFISPLPTNPLPKSFSLEMITQIWVRPHPI